MFLLDEKMLDHLRRGRVLLEGESIFKTTVEGNGKYNDGEVRLFRIDSAVGFLS